jgi:glycosyltransferase involved in cell wall biosynthesis
MTVSVMNAPVCVITPSLAQGRFIERTLDSVQAQRIPGLDHVVVDGGSTDETVAILRRHAGHLRFVSEPDQGQAEAVNKGLGMTGAAVIGWLNSDDVYYPGALAAVLEAFERHPEVDVIYGDADHIDEQDRVLEAYYTEAWALERLAEVCFLCQPAVFFRRRVVDRFGGLDAGLHYCMDYEYWLRLGQGGARFLHLPRTLAGSRLYAETKTLGARLKVHAEINTMLKHRLGRVPDRWLSNYAHVRLTDRGLVPDDPRFLYGLIAATFGASLHWNRGISGSLLCRLAGWLRGALLRSLRRRWAGVGSGIP